MIETVTLRPDLAAVPHSITVELLDADTARDHYRRQGAGQPCVVERHHGRLSKICVTSPDLRSPADAYALGAASTYGALLVERAEQLTVASRQVTAVVGRPSGRDLTVILRDERTIYGRTTIADLAAADGAVSALVDRMRLAAKDLADLTDDDWDAIASLEGEEQRHFLALRGTLADQSGSDGWPSAQF